MLTLFVCHETWCVLKFCGYTFNFLLQISDFGEPYNRKGRIRDLYRQIFLMLRVLLFKIQYRAREHFIDLVIKTLMWVSYVKILSIYIRSTLPLPSLGFPLLILLSAPRCQLPFCKFVAVLLSTLIFILRLHNRLLGSVCNCEDCWWHNKLI